MNKSKGEYSMGREARELVHDYIRGEIDRLGDLVAKLGVTAPEPTAREEFSLAEGSARDPRLPAPGSYLTRVWKGRRHTVQVLDQGFRYQGRTWPSLSAIAVHVVRPPSGAYNGYEFFGLGKIER